MEPRIKVRYKILLLFCLSGLKCSNAGISKCDKTPKGQTVEKTIDHGFAIQLNGSPKLYRPNQNYTISLEGYDGDQILKFQDFMLIAEPGKGSTLTDPEGLGTFELLEGEAMIQFSQKCSHAVKATSFINKDKAKVYWTAPDRGSGCIEFKAMIMERPDLWYMDDGALTYRLCEDYTTLSKPQYVQRCCACNEAKYEVIFEGLWSRHTHPKNFPEDEWRTQFSTLIGASHSKNYSLWDYGEYASSALRALGEHGRTRPLESQMKQYSQSIRSVIKAQGLQQRSNVIGKTFAVFRVDPTNHLLSLVSKMIPSPDFIVGISKENLCLSNCTWIPYRVIDLYPWDIGTDSGLGYRAKNNPQIPPKPITRITSTDPSDSKSPFFDPTGAPMNPTARIHIIRQRIYIKHNCGGFTENYKQREEEENVQYMEKVVEDEQDASPPEENEEVVGTNYSTDDIYTNPCEVSSYSKWSSCSQTCHPASRFQTRTYIRPEEALAANCEVQLTNKMLCKNLPSCSVQQYGGNFNIFESDNQVKSWKKLYGPNRYTDQSSDGINYSYDYASNSHKDNLEAVTQRDSSIILYPKPSRLSGDQIQQEKNSVKSRASNCEVTNWGDWSHCSTSCGNGVQTRSRRYGDWTQSSRCSEELHGHRSCHLNSCFDSIDSHFRRDRNLECDVSPWSPWSPCSQKCGNGYQIRTRLYIEPFVPNRSCDVQLIHKIDCLEKDCEDSSRSLPYEDLSVNLDFQNTPTYDFIQQSIPSTLEQRALQRSAKKEPNISFSRNGILRKTEDVNICTMSPDSGPCIGHYLRWYYNPNNNTCETFIFRGCEGNKNSFPSQDDCLETCKTSSTKDWKNSRSKFDPLRELQALSLVKYSNDEPLKPSLDCQVSNWSSWSLCSESCGESGWQRKSREIIVSASNGGKPCPLKLIKQKKCIEAPCEALDYSQWYIGSWRNMLS